MAAVLPGVSRAFRMLVVDPNDGPREAIQLIMRCKFPLVELDCVPDAPSAMQLLAEKGYDLLLTESWLPGWSGLELVRHVRANHARVSCAVMTAFDPVLTCKDIRDLRPSFSLMKPFAVDEFVDGVRRAMRLQGTHP
jgi:DNA-binding NtrC family response regulator